MIFYPLLAGMLDTTVHFELMTNIKKIRGVSCCQNNEEANDIVSVVHLSLLLLPNNMNRKRMTPGKVLTRK